MDTKKRPLTPISPTNPNKKQEVEKNESKEVNKNKSEKVEKNENKEIDSDNELSSSDDSYKEELNYCCSCNTEIKMESQICGRCAREMSYF